MRLDRYLVEQGYFESRNRALEAIKASKVTVDGKVAKASAKVNESSQIEVVSEKFYVSRAARKLESFLADHPVMMENKRALDIGSSTGGFAQIVLEQGVDSLTCVDVGRNQLHDSLRSDARLTVCEETDIRDFQSEEPFDLITCDVSFISVLQITDDIDRLAKEGTNIIILYKPQFEVGRQVKRDSRGVVVDSEAITETKEAFEVHCASLGWQQVHQAPSKVIGKEGNREFCYHYVKSERVI